MIQIQNYINGALVAPSSGEYIDNYAPATGRVYAQIPSSTKTDIDEAVRAAKAAFGEWSTMGINKRSEILNRIADLIGERKEELAKAESRDNGKPIWLANAVDIPRAESNFRFFATAIKHFETSAHHMEGYAVNYTLRQPIGVVGCISPWNLPLYLFSWKIAPALASGNCVVAKPSEVTPMTAYLLSEICIEAGLPPGVLNIVHGQGGQTGQALVEHDEIKAISFTGGTATGKKIAAIAAPEFKKLSLELGGKNPNIIFADCDFDAMLKTTIHSSFANNGQICLCGSRVFVERPIYEKFKAAFVAATKEMVVGDPFAKGVNLGAIVSRQHIDKIQEHIQIAQEEGGRILFGGNRLKLEGENADGYFMEPTIIEGLDYKCRTNQEEIFGPVVTITPFDTEEEVLEMANSTKYGLSATLWTKDIKRSMYFSEHLKAGIVWVNCWLLRDLRTPFGGQKNSGVGREGGWDALRFFTEAKNVCLKY